MDGKIELTDEESEKLIEMEGLFPQNRKDSIREAMQEHKNEKCLKCGLVFMADVHAIRCDNSECPMKSEDGKSLLDHWMED